MKDFNGDGLIGSYAGGHYVMGQQVKTRIPVMTYVGAGMLTVLAVWFVLIVLGFEPASDLASRVVEFVVAGRK